VVEGISTAVEEINCFFDVLYKWPRYFFGDVCKYHTVLNCKRCTVYALYCLYATLRMVCSMSQEERFLIPRILQGAGRTKSL